MNFYNKYLFEAIIEKIKEAFKFIENTLIKLSIDVLSPQSTFLLIFIIGYSLLYIIKIKCFSFYKKSFIVKTTKEIDEHITECSVYNGDIKINTPKTIIQIDEIKKTALCICYVGSLIDIENYAKNKCTYIKTTISGYKGNKKLYRTQNVAKLLDLKISNNGNTLQKLYDENYEIEIIFEEVKSLSKQHEIITISSNNIASSFTKYDKYKVNTFNTNIAINRQIEEEISKIKRPKITLFILLNILVYLISIMFIRVPVNLNHLWMFIPINIIAFIIMIISTAKSMDILFEFNFYKSTLENQICDGYFSQNTKTLLEMYNYTEKIIYIPKGIDIPTSNNGYKSHIIIDL